MAHTVLRRLLDYTESHIEHFLSTVSEQVINNEAALFLGTGLSMNSGLPGWKSLLHPCADELGLSLENEYDLYAIAQFYANKHSDSELRRIVSGKVNNLAASNSLLDELLDVGFSSIWTTNYDRLVERGLESRFMQYNAVFSDKNLASINKHDRVTIYKMNGDISDPTNMVVTKNDYERYSSKHPLFLTYLKKELVANTFLFVGYSFTDDLVLSSLSSIKDFLGDSSNNHYAIMMVDENNADQRFEYFTEDLKRRYNVNCIFALKEDIPGIICRLNRHIRDKKVFISGAYDTVPVEVEHFADDLSMALVHRLYDANYRISTGVGKRLGTFITGYAHQYLAEHNIANPSKYLSMRPFPFHLDLSDDKKAHYRKIMQHDCSAAIFLFGQSHSTTLEGSYDKTGHYSRGVYMEFEIARELGHVVIPVGATGYEAEVIWNEVKRNINEFYYLSKRIDALQNEKSPEKLSILIESILFDASKYRSIKEEQEQSL